MRPRVSPAWISPANRSPTGHPDGRWGERRGDDERIPGQVLRGDARVLRLSYTDHERQRIPRAARVCGGPCKRPPGDPTSVPITDLGAHGPRRWTGAAGG